MNVNDLTFGIEIECYAPGIVCGGYHVGRQIPGFPQGWNAQHDGSLGAGGTEIVSPVLKGEDGLLQVAEVVAKLNAMGAKVNSSCGFHIHVGWNKGVAELSRLVSVVANFEKAIFASTGTKAREASHYCRSIKTDYQNLSFGRDIRSLGCASRDRYHVLNISNLVSGAKPTIEFRAFAGTVNATKIISYIRLCLGLVERALTIARKPKWEAKKPVATSPIARDGEGQTELCRLFYTLGWTKGREKHVFGNLNAETTIPGAAIPSMKEAKKELMRLAKKYDACTR